MKQYSLILTSLLLIILGCIANGQPRQIPKKLKDKGEFIHNPSNTVFEELLFNLRRKDIYSFDKQDLNIGVTYKNEIEDNLSKESIYEIEDKVTTVSVYIYPAGDGAEDRLRSQYYISLQSIANQTKRGLDIQQFPVKYIGDNYICNGYKAVTKFNNKDLTQLTLYECGTWFFKLRITSNQLDTAAMAILEKKFTNHFDPSRLTSLKTLNPKADICFYKAAFRDSILLGSAMGSAFKKIEWAIENIPENERASGFPDIYLNMHIESLKEFVKFEKEKKFPISDDSTIKYLNELNSIIDSGFLAEYIMEQFGMIFIVPKNMVLDFDGFNKWTKSNPITIDLNKRFYVISYGQK